MKKRPAWLWAVHLETSTGTVNDVKTLLAIARLSGSVVALDCVSSLGAVPIASEAGPLFLASGVSGKSLGSYAGLAFVFVSKTCKSLLAGKTLCTSFDLLNMLRTRGPVSTVPSPSLFALACALQEHYGSSASIRHRFQDYSSLGSTCAGSCRAIGIEPLVPDEIAAPNITTFVLPTASFSSRCLAAGYQIASESNYLRARNWDTDPEPWRHHDTLSRAFVSDIPCPSRQCVVAIASIQPNAHRVRRPATFSRPPFQLHSFPASVLRINAATRSCNCCSDSSRT